MTLKALPVSGSVAEAEGTVRVCPAWASTVCGGAHGDRYERLESCWPTELEGAIPQGGDLESSRDDGVAGLAVELYTRLILVRYVLAGSMVGPTVLLAEIGV